MASYQRQQRTLHLLKLLAQGERDDEADRVRESAAVDATVRQRLAEHRRDG